MPRLASGLLAALAGLHHQAAATEQDYTALIQSSVHARTAYSQPEYARPHEHGWERSKNRLIEIGKEVDSIVQNWEQDSTASWNHWLEMKENTHEEVPTLQALSKRRCSGGEAQDPGVKKYLVDNGELQADTRGLSYRFSEKLSDTDLRRVAHWGSAVFGERQDGGWIKVGNCYLPEELHGKRVLRAA
mmetsp:Transcript_1978/g.6122  ORF Transcript_1978/g.6122 Transcript_1978/m.6122 type:complete len:188 (-) Transcript_1978:79-642(-)